jgi:hypothetical protein
MAHRKCSCSVILQLLRTVLLGLVLTVGCAPEPTKSSGGTGGTSGGSAPAGGGTGGGKGGSSGSGGTTAAAACGSRDVPIDSAGWVDLASTGCSIQGAWWWAKDDQGTTLEGVTADQPPFVAGKGMCVKGKTVADPTYAAWGAIIGLDLNSNQAVGWNATTRAVVGFDIEVTGTSGAELRWEYESSSNRTNSPPFVPLALGRNVVLVDRAVVPLTWSVTNAGEKPDPANLRKLQLHVVGGGAAAADFDVCISRVRPIVGNCQDFAMIDANGYKVNNNPWGKEDLTDYSQCVFATGAGADTRFGWLWRWPVSSPAWQVRGYPEIMAGKSPWSPVDTGHNLPAPITSQVALAFDLDLVVGANDAYDFAPEVWLTSDAQPSTDNIKDEIMFWFLHNNMTAAGSVVGAFSTQGVDYDVYVNPHQDPGGGSTVTGWQYVAFVAHTEVRSGTVQLKPFLDYLVGAGHITGTRYYAGVEFGTEIVNGSGSAIVKDFSVSVTP